METLMSRSRQAARNAWRWRTCEANRADHSGAENVCSGVTKSQQSTMSGMMCLLVGDIEAHRAGGAVRMRKVRPWTPKTVTGDPRWRPDSEESLLVQISRGEANPSTRDGAGPHGRRVGFGPMRVLGIYEGHCDALGALSVLVEFGSVNARSCPQGAGENKRDRELFENGRRCEEAAGYWR